MSKATAVGSHDVAPKTMVEPRGILLRDLIDRSLVLSADYDELPAPVQHELGSCPDRETLLAKSVEHRLLTRYQADRIAAGQTFGLVLGNHRVLDRLGAGGMGVVYKAEHIRMRRPVAIKVCSPGLNPHPRLLSRFYSEMRAVGRLSHPNIAAAFDAGEVAGFDPDAPVLHYLIMEFVPGRDLEALVSAEGPLSPAQVCDLGYQVAGALAEAHRHNLVHRDIKPSNIMLTPEGQAKLLDFGIARNFGERVTQPGVMLGTLSYLAPEQALDASMVDIRADIYGLGGTLFWCLTGRMPFPSSEALVETLYNRMNQDVPSVRKYRPDVSVDLDGILKRMMAPNPDDRYLTPQTVMRAFLTFLQPSPGRQLAAPAGGYAREMSDPGSGTPAMPTALIVDDEAPNRKLCTMALQNAGIQCAEAGNGVEALLAFRQTLFDVVILDIDMPEMNGTETLRRLRENPPSPNLKTIMISGRMSNEEMAQMLAAGADDYLSKPISMPQFVARVKASLRLKEAQDRADHLNRNLLRINADLERHVSAGDSDLVHARNALVLALAGVVQQREGENGAHLARVQRFSRLLADHAAALPNFVGQITEEFVQLVECCATLHDLGKVTLPDHILLNPGRLTAEDRAIMQTHTTVGADVLTQVARQHSFGRIFLQMAIDIARHHHERWDGTGYPDQLNGNAIPLAARIVSLADTYDALRSRRTYRPAFSRESAVEMIRASAGQFDPSLLQVFQVCADQMDRIFLDSVG